MKSLKLLLPFLTGLMAFSASAISLKGNEVPVHRPLIEEYTGTWCGWCVRGLAGMELLADTYGDEFIGVAYHDGDAMTIMSRNKFPNSVSGFPTAFIDRTSEVDPLYGFGDNTGEIIDAMEGFAAIEAIAGVELTAKWTSADMTDIAVDVTTYFTTDAANSNYAIEVMLIADDLHGTGSGWNQYNTYSGYSAFRNDPYLGEWVSLPSPVSGYHFNDVLIGTSGVVAGSLPSDIVAYEVYDYSYTFTLSNLVRPALVQNKDNLHIIAIVVNKNTKKAVNANRCYIDPYSLGDVNGDGEVNIDDVTALIGYLINQDASAIALENADMNHDGTIDIVDLTALIDKILKGN